MENPDIYQYKTIGDYSSKITKLIGARKLEESCEEIINFRNKIIDDFNSFRLNKNNVWGFLITQVGWITSEVEASQKGRDEYEEIAKKMVTEINISILIFAALTIRSKLPEDVEKAILNGYYREYSPIFVHKSKEVPGYAHFGESIFDKNYYYGVYRKLPEIAKKQYPTYTDGINKFEDFIKEKGKEFAKRAGLIKDA